MTKSLQNVSTNNADIFGFVQYLHISGPRGNLPNLLGRAGGQGHDIELACEAIAFF